MKNQNGDIEIVAPAGFELSPLDERYVRRSPVQLPPEDNRIATAYRFLTRSFRLMLEGHPVEPVFTVTPTLFVQLNDDEVALAARYQIRLHRGGLSSLRLRWPDLEEQNWSLRPGGSAGLAGWTRGADDDDQSVELRLTNGQTGDFTIGIDAD